MGRDLAIDYLRSTMTAAVVAHHAALAYNTFCHFNPDHYTLSTAPIVDPVRYAPLDYFVAWNDIYLMPLMFLISGLFVAPALARKGPRRFLIDRLKRLGIPFAVAVTLLMPIAFYPSWCLSNEAAKGGYLARFFTTDGWPAGPPWFLWLLLAFCALAALIARVAPAHWAKLSWAARSGAMLSLVFLAISLLATVPVRLFVAPYSWVSLGGPLAFQTSRLLFYFASFLLGVSLGRDLERSLSRENLRWWPLWLALGFAGFATHWVLSGGAVLTGTAQTVTQTSAFAACCTFTSLALLGIFRTFVHTSRAWADSLSANAYGIYIVHYVFVIWIQFGLLSLPWPPPMKFAITFAGALGASWFVTSAVRRTVTII